MKIQRLFIILISTIFYYFQVFLSLLLVAVAHAAPQSGALEALARLEDIEDNEARSGRQLVEVQAINEPVTRDGQTTLYNEPYNVSFTFLF